MLCVAVIIIQTEGRVLHREQKAVRGRSIKNETTACSYKVKTRRIAVEAMVPLPLS